MRNINILWADDEIDLLKIQIMFLKEKGHNVVTATNGNDAIELIKSQIFDILFLDENMPGLSGLATLDIVKNMQPNLPVVMITKSEEENIMDQAVGSKIADYLIKPVNPNQILLSLKKHVDQNRLITQKTTSAYQSEFTKLGYLINDARNFDDWTNVYRQLVHWELALEHSQDPGMNEVLKLQKSEANSTFAKYIKNNYVNWLSPKTEAKPLISPVIFKNKVLPLLDANEKVVFILVDNLRFDQWKTLQASIMDLFTLDKEELYYSILPTATQYSRNAIFSGLMPSEIYKLHPDLWLNDEEEGGKNLHEKELLQKQLSRLGRNIKFSFEKINNVKTGKKIIENIGQLLQNQLSVVIYNFIDMLSHARTEMEMIRELANDEAAYRSLTLSWFKHSTFFEFLKEIAGQNIKVIITTDHGTIKVNNPIKIVGDKNTTTNLRYKQGKTLNYNPKEVFEITQPEKAYLPLTNLSSTYVFACNEDFFAYPNNFHYYVNYYKSTFQHGGVSLEEMLIPYIQLGQK
jgi:CheY-like chemotaxis protein